MFFKFVKSDLRYGLFQNRWKLLLTFIIFAGLSFYHFLTLRIFELLHPEYFATAPTVGDYLLTIIGGCGKYEFDADNFQIFTMPVTWVIFVFWILFTNLYYPFVDLNGMGKHRVVISGQRGSWWVSKCLWVVANTVAVCGVIFLACTTTALIFGAKFSMDISHYMPSVLDVNQGDITSLPWNLTAFALGAVLGMICLSLLQMTVSLIVKPLYAYLILAAYAVAAAYIQSPILIGNYIMFARSSTLVNGGVTPMDGRILCLWLIVISCAAGFLYFKKMDILGGDW